MRAEPRRALACVILAGGALLLSGMATRWSHAQAKPSTQPPASQVVASETRAQPAAQAKSETSQQKATSQESKGAAPASEPATTAKYVGSETCKTCHEDLYKSWETTPHWKITYRHTNNQGCESCHGPGSQHVESGGQTPPLYVFGKMSVKQINERCLSCHEAGKEQMNFEHSTHAENGLSCTSCHSPHHAVEAQTLLVKPEPQLCYTCHASIQAQFRMPFHHKVNEGLVKCTDCHNPHGTFVPAQMRTAPQQEAVCFKCHTDKKGPFVFEHEPIKTEGCTACHSPMGSPNSHLLRYANVNQLCLQCHTISNVSLAPGTPNFHNQRVQWQACVQCHVQIHGSNFNEFFFK
jgi:DmsE family decaheme c-type cytochrome